MEQLSLFREPDNFRHKPPTVVMSKDFLLGWKERIYSYQQTVKSNPPSRQISLFAEVDHFDPEQIDPFELLFQPLEFYSACDLSESNCLYFLVDLANPILLYIGETKQNPKKRWLNHDCQDYIANYLDLHYRYKLSTNLRLGFWWDTPKERQDRENIEQLLIGKWRAPFNKQCWDIYGQPFKKIAKN